MSMDFYDACLRETREKQPGRVAVDYKNSDRMTPDELYDAAERYAVMTANIAALTERRYELGTAINKAVQATGNRSLTVIKRGRVQVYRVNGAYPDCAVDAASDVVVTAE